mmetsp:Transcript_38578/g.110348  ORF Transcript_38578/g.110348 Transcript_38578/m.110348 type:complete len:510 (+) Transcript_38578:39-1568(+)
MARQCEFFLVARQRKCTFPAVEGSDFCSVHRPEDRIPCPLDPRHSIFASKADSHLLICTHTRDLAYELCLPCMKDNCNGGSDDEAALSDDDKLPGQRQVNHADESRALFGSEKEERAFGERIDVAYERACGFIGIPPEELLLPHDPGPAQRVLSRLSLTRQPHDGAASSSVLQGWLDTLSDDEVIHLIGAFQLSCQQSVAKRCEARAASAAGSEDRASGGDDGTSCADAPTQSRHHGWFDHMDKHELQAANILTIAAAKGWFRPTDRWSRAVFVELGAGKGGLCRWFLMASAPHVQSDTGGPAFVLVEREKRRFKRDGRDETMSGADWAQRRTIRLRSDLLHFDLKSLLRLACLGDTASLNRRLCRTPPAWLTRILRERRLVDPSASGEEQQHQLYQQILKLAPKGHGQTADRAWEKLGEVFDGWRANQCVGLAKHLCGCGTDIALRSMHNAHEGLRDAPSREHVPSMRIIAAPCCHHRCEWSLFTGKEFLTDLGLTKEDFPVLAACAG